MKTIRLIAALLLFLTAGLCMAQNSSKPDVTWKEPSTGFDSSDSAFRIKEVRFYKDRTELSVHVDFRPGYWILVEKATYLQSGDKRYQLKAATVLTVGKKFYMPESGQIDFEMIFEPLPADCRTFDFMEPKGWMVRNIHHDDYVPEGIADTYWRNDATGDWFIAFTPECVVYDCRFWEIISQTEDKDTYRFTLSNSGITMPVEVGKLRKGKRSVVVDGQPPVECSIITSTALPDYPHKDTRRGFKDTGYKEGECVTFTGWLKDMPEQMWKRGKEFEISYENILSDESENAYARMDSLGRFSINMPLLNTTEVFLDWERTTVATVLEPGETYFFIYDFHTGRQMFMGKNVRLQNELIAHPMSWDSMDFPERGKADAQKIWKDADQMRADKMSELRDVLKSHPALSQRYEDYVEGYYHMGQASDMMQARFYTPKFTLPQDYMQYVGKEFWQKRPRPYTLYRDFGFFMRDYIEQLTRQAGTVYPTVSETLLKFEKEGKVSFTEAERDILRQYPEEVKDLLEKMKGVSEDQQNKLLSEFNSRELVKNYNALTEPHLDAVIKEHEYARVQTSIEVVDSVGCDKELRDIHIAREIYRKIDNTRQPLPDNAMILVGQMTLPAAKNMVLDLNGKYLALQKRDISRSDNLKSNESVRDMTDGEKILRSLIEPHKGKIILLDIWGTWCAPCRAALARSQELYARMKEYDMVFLYLANNSNEKTWKAIIEEYKVSGDNVVHYNLPAVQQSAVEKFLKVNSWPTYKLIDQEGNILDVNADPRIIDTFEKMIRSMK